MLAHDQIRNVIQQTPKKQIASYKKKEKFENKYVKDKKYRKARDHCYYAGVYRGAAHGICTLKHSAPK